MALLWFSVVLWNLRWHFSVYVWNKKAGTSSHAANCCSAMFLERRCHPRLLHAVLIVLWPPLTFFRSCIGDGLFEWRAQAVEKRAATYYCSYLINVKSRWGGRDKLLWFTSHTLFWDVPGQTQQNFPQCKRLSYHLHKLGKHVNGNPCNPIVIKVKGQGR